MQLFTPRSATRNLSERMVIPTLSNSVTSNTFRSHARLCSPNRWHTLAVATTLVLLSCALGGCAPASTSGAAPSSVASDAGQKEEPQPAPTVEPQIGEEPELVEKQVAPRVAQQADAPKNDETDSPADPRLAERDRLKESAANYYRQGKTVLAIEESQRQLDLEIEIFGAQHADVAATLENLCELLMFEERLDEARTAMQRAKQINTALHGPDDWRVRDNQTGIDFLDIVDEMDPDERWQMFDSEEQSIVMAEQRRFLEAVEYREEALTAYLKIVGRDHLFTAILLIEIARSNLALGEIEEAGEELQNVLTILENTVGTSHPRYGSALDLLAEYEQYNENYERAEAYYRQALSIQKAAYGTEHAEYSTAVNNLATLFDSQERYEEAVPLYREAMEIIRPAEGNSNRDYDITLNNLARALVELAFEAKQAGDIDRALKYTQEARDLRAERFGNTHWLVTSLDIDLVDFAERKAMPADQAALLQQADELYDESNRLDQEEQDYEAALLKAEEATQLVEQVRGKQHIQFAWKSQKVGDLLIALSRFEEAEPLYRGAEVIFQRDLGENDPRFATVLSDQGRLYYYMEDYDRAKTLFERALAIYDRLAEEESSKYDFGYQYGLYYADAISYLGTINSDQGDYAEAERLFKEALHYYRIHKDADLASYATGLYDLGTLYIRTNDNIHAEPLLLESLQVTREVAGKESFDYAERLTSLGTLYVDNERYSDAEPILLEAVGIFEKLAPDHEDYLSLSLYQLGTNYRLQDRFEESCTIMERVRDIDARYYGKDHTEYSGTLNQLGIIYTATEQYEEATACFEEALSIWLQHNDPTTAFTGRILYNHAYVLADAIKFTEAKPLLEKAAKVYEHMAGEDPPTAAYEFLDVGTLYDRIEEKDLSTATLLRSLELCRDYISSHNDIVESELMTLATTLRSLGPLFVERDDIASALEAGRQLLIVEQQLHGVNQWQFTNAKLQLNEIQLLATLKEDQHDTLDQADGALNYAHELIDEGELDEALKSMQRACDLYREVLGNTHRDTISTIIELSNLLVDLGRRTEAEPLLVEALKAREVMLGKSHPDYSVIVTKVGNLYRDLGQYRQAQEYLLLALEIDAEIYGRNHDWYAHDLKNLASLCNLTSNPSLGLPYARQASDIFRQLRGEENSDYLESLNLMAIFYHYLRDFDAARELYVHVLERRKEALGEKDSSTLTSMNNLAVLYSDTKMHEEAESLMLQVLQLRKELFGERSESVASSMRNLASLYTLTKKLDEAIALFEQAIDIRSELDGPEHPEVVELQSLLGQTHLQQGNYKQAEPLLQATLERQLEDPEQNLQGIAGSYFALSLLFYNTDRIPQAIDYLDQSLILDQKLIERLSTLTERDIQANHQAQAFKLDHMIAMAAAVPDNREAVRKAFDWTLRRKAAVLDTMCRLRAVEDVFDLEPDIARQASRLRELRQEIADLALNPPAGSSQGEVRRLQQPLEQEAQEVEARLRSTLQSRRSTQVTELPNADQVRQQLDPDTALVEFVRASVYDSANPGSTYFSGQRYFAFVLTASDPTVKMIDLGDGTNIDTLIEQLREETERTPQGLRIIGEFGLESSFAELSHELYELVFEPLTAALGDTKRLLLAPDRALHMVPFAALVDSEGQYLIESLQIGYLSTGRDLLRTFKETGRSTVVFAGPNYDLLLADRATKAQELRDMDAPAFALASRGEDPELRSMRWKHLAGAELEADDVQEAVKSTDYGPVELHVGDSALEELFKNVHSPRILHVATHGFFLQQRDEEDSFASSTAPADDRYAAAVGFSRLRNSADPLLRSGIVLAGANDFISSGETTADVEDGWVTAAEIAMLDLSGTEMVVLSACESGLGEISTREGVFGLRRSFFHAGARALVTSLFKVPDNETRLLMQRFYQELAAGKSKLDALREAQLSVIQRRRETNEAAHPFFWASFVLVGDPN